MAEAREVIAKALEDNQVDMVPCPQCDGRGYHHGFGEHGHDPDWCTKCDGAQIVHSGVEPVDAILSALHDAGLKVVGREPTEAMVAGMRDAWDYFDANDDVFRREWQGAFDAAAPTKEK